MLQTKRELIQQYKEGKLTDHASYSFSAFDHMVIVELDSDHVFGYYQYMDMPKQFFKVRLQHSTNFEKLFFTKDGNNHYLENFMRINL